VPPPFSSPSAKGEGGGEKILPLQRRGRIIGGGGYKREREK